MDRLHDAGAQLLHQAAQLLACSPAGPLIRPSPPPIQPSLVLHMHAEQLGVAVESGATCAGSLNPAPATCALSIVQRNQWRWVMVLQHAHSFHGSSAVRVDTARIAAGSGAIALNVAVLLLLLIPAGMPSLVPGADRPTTFVPIDRIKPPVPPTPPEQVEITKPQQPVTRAPVKPEVVQPVVEQILVDEGSLQADEIVAPPVDTGPVDIAPSGPVSGMRLEYAKAPSPPYPRDALIEGLQGTVLLQVLVDVDGRPLRVDIQQSSGHRKLDDAARKFVLKHWTFRPAMRNGQPVQAVGIVPIAFNLG